MAFAGYGNSVVRGGFVTTPPTSQTNPLDPVFSGVPVVIPQGELVNPTWNKWFVDLREKVNVINSTLAIWAGITPSGITEGTYGDSTHYPVVTVNEFGLVTAITVQSVSGGGGNPIQVTNTTADITVALSNVPNASANKGLIVVNSMAATTVSIDTFANTGIPVGTDLAIYQQNTGTVSIVGLSTVSLIGPSITGGGQGAFGRLIQITTDTWIVSGNIAYSSGGDPYWADVISLLHFQGSNGGTTFTDQVSGNTWSVASSGFTTSTAQFKFGTSSGNSNGSGTLSLPNNTKFNFGTSDFTIEFWFYFTTVPASNSIETFTSSYVNSTGWNIQFRTDSPGNRLVLGQGDTQLASASWTPTAGQWYFITIVSHSQNIMFFVNGVQQGSTTAITTSLTTSGNPIFISGLNYSGYIQQFNGYIEEYRVTAGVARYTANFTPPTAPFPNN